MFIIDKNGKILNWYEGQLTIENDEVKADGKKVYFPASDVSVHEIPEQDLSHLKDEQGNIQGNYPADVQTQFDSPFLDPTAEYDAKVIEIDPSHGKKVLKVEREINGQKISAWCYASGTLYHQYQAGEFDVGDRVIISFARKSLEYPWAQDRVYKF